MLILLLLCTYINICCIFVSAIKRNKKLEIMTISIENNVLKVIDFKLNGVLVAVIGLIGGLQFLRSARNLTIKEIESVETAASKYNESQYKKINHGNFSIFRQYLHTF